MSNNFVNQKRKIFTATPRFVRKTKKSPFPNAKFLPIDKRACSYLKCDPTFVDEWHSEISTSYQQRKGGRMTGRLADERNGRASCVSRIKGGERKEWRPREYVHTRMNVHGRRRERRKGRIHRTSPNVLFPTWKMNKQQSTMKMLTWRE
jgi:hypothetical protein